jgi:hypothetical protein
VMPDEAAHGAKIAASSRTLADKVNWLISAPHPAGCDPYTNAGVDILLESGRGLVSQGGRYETGRRAAVGQKETSAVQRTKIAVAFAVTDRRRADGRQGGGLLLAVATSRRIDARGGVSVHCPYFREWGRPKACCVDAI